jgi:tRNA threonylcarbamoyladenosine biosynthesis protein TsaE
VIDHRREASADSALRTCHLPALVTPIAVDVIARTEEEMQGIGALLYKRMGGSGVVALIGDLGAGKTCFVRGFCKAAGVDPELVSSPTFSLVHEYTGSRQRVCHFDFYRINTESELWEIGWQDYLDDDAILVVEWADRFPAAFPANTYWMKLDHVDHGRRIRSGELEALLGNIA